MRYCTIRSFLIAEPEAKDLPKFHRATESSWDVHELDDMKASVLCILLTLACAACGTFTESGPGGVQQPAQRLRLALQRMGEQLHTEPSANIDPAVQLSRAAEWQDHNVATHWLHGPEDDLYERLPSGSNEITGCKT